MVSGSLVIACAMFLLSRNTSSTCMQRCGLSHGVTPKPPKWAAPFREVPFREIISADGLVVF
jgi:hypothetical protein